MGILHPTTWVPSPHRLFHSETRLDPTLYPRFCIDTLTPPSAKYSTQVQCPHRQALMNKGDIGAQRLCKRCQIHTEQARCHGVSLTTPWARSCVKHLTRAQQHLQLRSIPSDHFQPRASRKPRDVHVIVPPAGLLRVRSCCSRTRGRQCTVRSSIGQPRTDIIQVSRASARREFTRSDAVTHSAATRTISGSPPVRSSVYYQRDPGTRSKSRVGRNNGSEQN